MRCYACLQTIIMNRIERLKALTDGQEDPELLKVVEYLSTLKEQGRNR